MVDVIEKKRNGGVLSKEEIHYFVEGYTEGTIPDYQASALMMAVYFRGMTAEETGTLTEAMVQSGDVIDLSSIHGHKVDKHSTGGVGDKISFITGPLVAAAGVPVAKMSGRGLGHTGGTIDKLESIAGFNVEMSKEAFTASVNEHKLAVAGQTGNLAPADKKLYSLRDVTATVDSIPLIAGSIMSKKLASGADSIVLDVKTGSGAFMKSLEDSRALAEEMVRIGDHVGRETLAVISDMNQPLGHEIGNANEIREAAAVLSGENIPDLRKLSLELAVHMTLQAGAYSSEEEARRDLEASLDDGRAFQAFRTFVQAQGGDVSMIDDLSLLPRADHEIAIPAEHAGWVQEIDAASVGTAAMYLGAGRATKDDEIDHGVGITLKKKIGDYVEAGETLAVLTAASAAHPDAEEKLRGAYTIGASRQDVPELIHDIIRA